jgi:hypothetical protein
VAKKKRPDARVAWLQMSAIATLRELWRLRPIIRVGIVVAILGALLVSYRVSLGVPPAAESRQYVAGVAAAEVLVDSPRSQVVDLGGGEADDEAATAEIDILGLSTRARLLASLMASDPLKENIASAARVRPERLIVVGPPGEDMAPRPPASTTVSPGDRDANVLSLFVDETLPIITIQAEAPDAITAERLAAAAVSELPKYLRSIASAKSIPDARQLVVESLGPPTSREVVKGPGRVMAIVVGILILGGWCLGAVLIRRTANRWAALDQYESALAAEAAAELERARAERHRSNGHDRDETAGVWVAPPSERERARRP